MTRKDFELVARVLAFVRETSSSAGGLAAVDRVIEDLTAAFEEAYPAFNAERFLHATWESRPTPPKSWRL